MSSTVPLLKQSAARAIETVGLTGPTRWVYQRVVPVARRNRLDNAHQRLLMAFCLAADSNCIDVGAHEGDVLDEIVRCAPEGKHIAFEPLPAQAARLRARFPGVEVHEAALSDSAGSASYVHVQTSPQMSGLRERDYGGPQQLERIEVKTERLDDVLPEGYSPDLIKIDVEGAELMVLRGALKTLRTHRPIVVFEHGVGSSEHYTDRPSAALYELLVEDVGLRIFDIDGAGPYSKSEFEAMFTKPLWVWVARP